MPNQTIKEISERLDRHEIRMDTMEAELGKLVRRVDSLHKSVDLMSQDREILEDIQATLVSFKSLLSSSREHTENMVKDVKADIAESSQQTQQKVENAIEEGVSGIIDRIAKRKDVVVKPDNWFVRLFRREVKQ